VQVVVSQKMESQVGVVVIAVVDATA
jgi:hypothetical protein